MVKFNTIKKKKRQKQRRVYNITKEGWEEVKSWRGQWKKINWKKWIDGGIKKNKRTRRQPLQQKKKKKERKMKDLSRSAKILLHSYVKFFPDLTAISLCKIQRDKSGQLTSLGGEPNINFNKWRRWKKKKERWKRQDEFYIWRGGGGGGKPNSTRIDLRSEKIPGNRF